MFLPIKFESKNKIDDLQHGEYKVECFVYQSTTDTLKAFFYEYSLGEEDSISAYELMIIDANEDVFFRDFMKMPDRTWRDSYGARADYIEQLLPPEIMKYEMIGQMSLGTVMVGG